MVVGICYEIKVMAAAKKKSDADDSKSKKGCRGGCIKSIFQVYLLVAIFYLGVHVYFMWQPAGNPDGVTQQVMNAQVAGVKIFPAVEAYPMAQIAGRTEIMEGRSIPAPMLKERLQSAIERNYPLTLREEEINAWLGKRLDVRQGGKLAPFVKIRGLWVDFKQDQIELIIERELPWGKVHVTSLFMSFEQGKRGFSISRHSCHIGQVRLPGGFARLVSPAFDNLAQELEDELKPYYNMRIHDIRIEDGKITLDPRLPDERL